MNRSELEQELAYRHGLSKRQANAIIGSFVRIVCEQITDGNDVEIRGFGRWSSRLRRSSRRVVPGVGEVELEGRNVPTFKPHHHLVAAAAKTRPPTIRGEDVKT